MAEITYDLLKDKKVFDHLPILILDQRWHSLVTEHNKTAGIKYWERQVIDLMKKQSRVTDDIKRVKNIKEQLIRNVVEHMEDDDADSKKLKRMNASTRLIQEAKEKISALEQEEDELPSKLRYANQQLLVETMNMCYETINSNRDEINELDEWINATRVELKRKLLVKQDKENVNDAMYSVMHDIVGAAVMGELDRINDSK